MTSAILSLLLVQGFVTIITSAPLDSNQGIVLTEGSGDNDPTQKALSLEDQADVVCETFNLTVAAEYLERYGYNDLEGWEELTEDQLELALTDSFILFQKKMEINQTGVFDETTKHEMCMPRCDFPDILTSKSARVKRYSIVGRGWDFKDLPLTVGFAGHSRKMKRADQEKAFMQAAESWAKVSGLSFKKGPSRGSDITISFGHYDGPWGVLAKAWFPKDGRIIFENNENWESRIPKGGSSQGRLSFYSVAMHELGHALGIEHSNVKTAIMHAQYQRDVVSLQRDDINAAVKLYGPSSRGNRGNGFGSNTNRRAKNKGSRKLRTRNKTRSRT